MKHYHVVGIVSHPGSLKGLRYRFLQSFDTMIEAAADAIKRGSLRFTVFVRDGTTGRRYCIEELNTMLIGGGYFAAAERGNATRRGW